MSSSGWRTAGTTATRGRRRTGRRGRAAGTAVGVCCVAVPGSTSRGSSARRTATGTASPAAAAASASVWRGRSPLESLPPYILHFVRRVVGDGRQGVVAGRGAPALRATGPGSRRGDGRGPRGSQARGVRVLEQPNGVIDERRVLLDPIQDSLDLHPVPLPRRLGVEQHRLSRISERDASDTARLRDARVARLALVGGWALIPASSDKSRVRARARSRGQGRAPRSGGGAERSALTAGSTRADFAGPTMPADGYAPWVLPTVSYPQILRKTPITLSLSFTSVRPPGFFRDASRLPRSVRQQLEQGPSRPTRLVSSLRRNQSATGWPRRPR